MKLLLRFFLCLSIFFGMISSMYADYGFAVKKTTDDSISFTWDKKEGIHFYQVFYSTKSAPEKYDKETDVLEGTSTTVNKLEKDKKYYFILKGFDNSGNTVFTSEELEGKPDSAVSVSQKPEKKNDFELKAVKQTGVDEITLTFSNNISSKQKTEDRALKIEAVNDLNDYFSVVNSEIDEKDPKKLIVTLSGTPNKSVEYKVVVISLQDESGNSMKYGIDTESTFIGGYEQELNAAAPVVDPNPAQTTQESDTTPESTTPTKSGVSGQDMQQSDIKKDVQSVSKGKEKLPNTGPEHVLLFFLALLMSAFFFVPRYIKK